MKKTLQAAMILMVLTALPAASAAAQGKVSIDTERSTLTVYVYRSGVFSFAGDDHEIRVPIASGSIDETGRNVELTVQAAQMRVMDPKLDAGKRAEVQEKMLSPEGLDAERYRDIAFRSTSVEARNQNEWLVHGNLTLHGETRPIELLVSRVQGQFRGETTLKQTNFGMKPIRVAGGTVKVKDEVKIVFAIFPR
jgi:polyisoprenoid-binding protein YceI